MDLIGRERVVDLVAQHPHEPLPRRALLRAQRAAQVGQHQQLVRPAVLPESSAAHLPAPGAPGKGGLERARRLALQARGEPQRVRVQAQQPLGRLAQQPLAAAVHQPEPLLGVEGEDGDVDLLDDAPEQRRGLERAAAAARAASRSSMLTSSRARPSAVVRRWRRGARIE